MINSNPDDDGEIMQRAPQPPKPETLESFTKKIKDATHNVKDKEKFENDIEVMELRASVATLNLQLDYAGKELIKFKKEVAELSARLVDSNLKLEKVDKELNAANALLSKTKQSMEWLKTAVAAEDMAQIENKKTIERLKEALDAAQISIAGEKRQRQKLTEDLAAAQALVPIINRQVVNVAAKDRILGPTSTFIAGAALVALAIGILILLQGLGIDLASLGARTTAGIIAGSVVAGVSLVALVVGGVFAIRAMVRNLRTVEEDVEAQNAPSVVPSSHAKLSQRMIEEEQPAVSAAKGKARVETPALVTPPRDKVIVAEEAKSNGPRP